VKSTRTVVKHGLLIADELVTLDAPRRIDEDGVELAQRSQIVVSQVAVDKRTLGPIVRLLVVTRSHALALLDEGLVDDRFGRVKLERGERQLLSGHNRHIEVRQYHSENGNNPARRRNVRAVEVLDLKSLTLLAMGCFASKQLRIDASV
jgi:hypothetical protein